MQKIDIVAKDGAIVKAIFYEVDNESKKGVIIICHGFGEHSGAYLEFAEILWKAGYASAILDQRGHGTFPVTPEKFQGQIPQYRCFVDDVLSVAQKVLETAPDTKLFLYGHSMGGNIAVNTLLQANETQARQFSCAVFEAPWFGLYKPLDGLKKSMINFLKIIAPTFTVSSKIDHGELSADEERSAGYGKDPLYHSRISVRMLTGIMEACDYALSNAKRLPIPIFLAYADKETVVCNKTIKKFAENAGDIVTLKEYKSHHSIHNDESRELFSRDVIEFFDLHQNTR